MLVPLNIEVVQYRKMEKGVGQRARVGGGPHWARLDLGVQVSLHIHAPHLPDYQNHII